MLRRRLLSWYQSCRRDLPWRRTSDPYAIWISETMLQQTQVATVLHYYDRFMKAFPDIESLNRAPLARVLAHWSGLGYYRRAENLKKSARIVTARYAGQLPADYENLRALPGIGDYTAGALLSIAFGKPYPALDGNVRRVLSRLFLVAGEKRLRDIAWRLVFKPKPGEFNQSLMELGSVLCTPSKPRCAECPVGTLCRARKTLHDLPSGKRKKGLELRTVVWPLAIVRSNGRFLLHRRPAGGILAGLWELPGGEQRKRRRTETFLAEYFPQEIASRALCLGEIAHTITNRRIRAPIYLIDVASTTQVRSRGGRWRWVPSAALDRQPTSAMTRKAAKLLSDYEKRNS